LLPHDDDDDVVLLQPRVVMMLLLQPRVVMMLLLQPRVMMLLQPRVVDDDVVVDVVVIAFMLTDVDVSGSSFMLDECYSSSMNDDDDAIPAPCCE
jgi:hypothetical protein